MLNQDTIQRIQELQASGIKNKALTPEQLDLIYSNNWFNLWVPKELSGLEIPFLDGLNLLEELAYWDGGLAWTVTLCAGANMFAGFIDPQLAKLVWQDPKVCFGGSGRVGGKAELIDDNYVISGFWSYATGAPHLTHFTLNAEIVENGQVLKNDAGESVYYSFFVPREDVLVHYDWDTFGLECTASHSFSLDKIQVPKSHAFILDPAYKSSDSALFNIPFMPFAELTLLMNYTGMFRRFLDLIEKYYFEKSKDQVWAEKFSKLRFRQIDGIRSEFDTKVQVCKELAGKIWDDALLNKVGDEEVFAEVGRVSRELAKAIRMNVAELMPLLGIRAAQKENEMNIVIRNLFTASQHSLLNL